MLRLKKILLVAGLAVAGLVASTSVGTTSAQAGDFGYGYGYGLYNHCYTPTYYAPVYHTPVYHHCYPTYGYGLGFGY